MPSKFLKVHLEGSVAVIGLNRPDVYNALGHEILQALGDLFRRYREDSSVHGVILTGEGKNFCAGADVSEMQNLTSIEAAKYSESGQKMMFGIENLGKPVIAAVRGFALGGGLELALACDIIIASETAHFAAPEIRLGIIPGFGGTQRLPRLVGKSKAKELIFTGDRIRAAEAFNIGLVNRVVPDADLLPQALKMMQKICMNGLLSMKLAKEVIDAGYDIDLRTACLLERNAFSICFSSDDQKEGMTAFIEKRPARFKGK